jgi:hypothetical protein
MKCEGQCENCGGHKGEVKRFRVKTKYIKYGAGPRVIDWGLFWYCETAVKTDRENDFSVTEE